jgi:DNA-binding protein HU-beta
MQVFFSIMGKIFIVKKCCIHSLQFIMNKSELINAIVEKTEVNKGQAEVIIAATVSTIMQAVAQGDKVTLTGFGSFSTQARSMREVRHPKTGMSIVVPRKVVPNFSAGTPFRRAVAPASVVVVRKKKASESSPKVAQPSVVKPTETTVKVLVSPKSSDPSQAWVKSIKKGLKSAFKFLG